MKRSREAAALFDAFKAWERALRRARHAGLITAEDVIYAAGTSHDTITGACDLPFGKGPKKPDEEGHRRD